MTDTTTATSAEPTATTAEHASVVDKAAVAEDRRRRVVEMALPALLGMRKAFAAARRAYPVLVVAVPDVPLGARLILDRYGRQVLAGLAGAMVIPMADDEFLATFAGGDPNMRAQLAASLARLDGGPRVALVVNDGAIEVVNVREQIAKGSN